MRKLIATIALLAVIDTWWRLRKRLVWEIHPHHLLNRRTRTADCCRHQSATANRGSIKCPTRRTWVIRTIQSIARTRRLTTWSKAFAAVAE
jgi:hypothetical protein